MNECSAGCVLGNSVFYCGLNKFRPGLVVDTNTACSKRIFNFYTLLHLAQNKHKGQVHKTQLHLVLLLATFWPSVTKTLGSRQDGTRTHVRHQPKLLF